MKKITLFMIILSSFLLISCVKDDTADYEGVLYKAEEAPSITVTYSDTYMDYHTALNFWDNTMYDRLDSVAYIIQNSDVDNIPYIENDTAIHIEFSKKPDSITVKDTLIDKEGKLRYGYKAAVVDVDIKLSEQISLTVKPHPATALSSNTDDYKPASALRGIKIVCTYGKNECEYAFVYRSDPIGIFDEEAAKENNVVAGKQIYIMDTPDEISDWQPNTGEINMSSGVEEFIDLNLSNGIYLEVCIMISYQHDTFMSRDEYKYMGKTVIELKNDSLAKQYDDYVSDFKEKYAGTDEYNKRKEKGEFDDMYREYLLSIADDENNIEEIIKAYDTYVAAEKEYINAERLYINTQAKEIYGPECKRLAEEGLDVSTVGDDSTYYCLKGVLNRDHVEQFPVGDFGYTITLFYNQNDPIDE